MKIASPFTNTWCDWSLCTCECTYDCISCFIYSFIIFKRIFVCTFFQRITTTFTAIRHTITPESNNEQKIVDTKMVCAPHIRNDIGDSFIDKYRSVRKGATAAKKKNSKIKTRYYLGRLCVVILVLSRLESAVNKFRSFKIREMIDIIFS